MAIIKNGKIRGRIGNFVYRVVNGKEIIQSYPRKSKTKKRPTELNIQFGNTVRMTTKIYRLVKEFSLNMLDGSFFRELVRLLKFNFYSDIAITEDPEFMDWHHLHKSKEIAISKSLKIDNILFRYPQAEVNDGLCVVKIPAYNPARLSSKLRNRADCIEFVFTLIHYDFEQDHAEVISKYVSDRLWSYHVSPEKTIEVPLKSSNGDSIDRGVIMVCFGIRFYAAMDSEGYLNTKEINPTGVLGVWYKKAGGK